MVLLDFINASAFIDTLLFRVIYWKSWLKPIEDNTFACLWRHGRDVCCSFDTSEYISNCTNHVTTEVSFSLLLKAKSKFCFAFSVSWWITENYNSRCKITENYNTRAETTAPYWLFDSDTTQLVNSGNLSSITESSGKTTLYIKLSCIISKWNDSF